MHSPSRLIIALAAAALLIAAFAWRGPAQRLLPWHRAASAPPGTAVVVRVVDGDTVILHVGGADESTRLLGIDTPETVKPNTPVQCYGPEASSNMKHLLPPGSRVRVRRDVEPRDRYGRLLLYLWRLPDGLFLNQAQVDGGFARILVIAPNGSLAPQLREAAARAQRAHRGLWGACPPQPSGGGS